VIDNQIAQRSLLPSVAIEDKCRCTARQRHGRNVEPELIKRLDAIRTQNKIESMEELEKAVTAQGMNWEDFKNNIRSTLLTQRVISNEVGSHITISDEEISNTTRRIKRNMCVRSRWRCGNRGQHAGEKSRKRFPN